jgi:putative tryptophan/tyrosine transport system substrate-binding protein
VSRIHHSAPSQLSRRDFARGIIALGLATSGLPLLGGCRSSGSSPAAREQPSARVYRVGWLGEGTSFRDSSPLMAPSTPNPLYQRFLDRLAELGYVEGRTLHWEVRAATVPDQLAAHAAELAGLNLDLILVLTSVFALRAAVQAPGTTPVVACFGGPTDPVRDGYAQSLAHPGGKVTGVLLSPLGDVFYAKQLEIFKDVLPTLARLGIHFDLSPENPITRDQMLAIMLPPARALGIELVIEEVRALEEIEGAFARMAQAGVDGVFLRVRVGWTGAVPASRMVGWALDHRLPVSGLHRVWAEAGALATYSVDLAAQFARTAEYVDKVLRGARPAEVPIEQPAKYDLFINQRTAATLGLTVPPVVLARAPEVIQ